MILRVILVFIILYVMYRIMRHIIGWDKHKRRSVSNRHSRETVMEELVEDPVCHTYLPISQAIMWEGKGEKRYFCSQTCLKQYREREVKQ